MKTQVIQVSGKREVRDYYNGRIVYTSTVYPEGTQRIITRLNVFPQKLGEQMEGWFRKVCVLQEAMVVPERVPGEFNYMWVNHWKDLEYLVMPSK